MTTTALMNTYGERKLTLVKGEGIYLWDDQGRRYLDALSGIAVCGLGHSHAGLAQAISEQANTLMHVSNLFNTEPSEKLAELLCSQTGMENVFFSNSGAEANEAAIKIARKYGNDKGVKTPTIITMNGSFHGRTMATLSATGNPKVKQGFAPLLEGFVHVDYNNVEAVKALANDPAMAENIVAILVEPVQGEGGVIVPDEDYLAQLREVCNQSDWLLMLDEIQTGNGRTGELFAFQHTDLMPDVLTTAKGLGNGLPIGACMARGKAATVLQPGNHGSTYGGNPLVCQGALTVIRTLIDEQLIANAKHIGAYLLSGFNETLKDDAKVKNIRGKGLMVGIELTQDCPELVALAAQAGLILNVTAGSTIRLLPPLITQEADADQIINIVSQLIREL
ncbi:aspartate aminotransferase family protein [Aestuariicella hydrocarbonica]|uniref:Acetylornithine aminotransferase n=1 Tax=Pseudomaricurvus hydrocarbonicus TaxID=1470433 RepID=A0A9E5MLQ1_9GAMM|nr:aspartate aminotransferase family protein [Aestuariicella hydrocarbonica]NHO64370.1 aspartate aminotransferase family protein [Aestuariicella hydrocarbonica]